MPRLKERLPESAAYRPTITDWPEAERPRERLLAHGPGALSVSELLAILIRTGSRKATAVDLANSLLVKHKSIGVLASRSAQELMDEPGLKNAKAISLVAAFELGRRAAASHAGEEKIQIRGPHDIVSRYQPRLRDERREIFMVILLDTKNQILQDTEVTRGTLNSSLAHPREVFRLAIAAPAASIVLLHNHPSGNPDPSPDDMQVTRQIVEAGKIIGIPVHDHIIVTATGYCSFVERGIL
ncbi:MAG TPA: DNA repair protein RadC [Bacteroidota bacterium]|nr:DNA repair protein RadC [Bacteroidota bacterium]